MAAGKSPFAPEVKPIVNDDFVRPALWGKDHWSTFAYIEDRCVQFGDPYIVGIDGHMKTNRRHIRVFVDERAFNSPRARRFFNGRGQPDWRPEHATRLNDGTQVEDHDDWMCLQDFLAAGLVRCRGNEIQPRRKIRLTPLGLEVAARLRAHKAGGGNFAAFRWQPEGVAVDAQELHAG